MKKLSKNIIFIGVVLLIGILIIGELVKRDNILIDIVSENDCSNKAELYYSDEDRNIYTYCVNETNIKNSNKTIDLREYLKDNDGKFDNIINMLELKDSLFDGGTKIYKGDITLIECNTIDGNRDIYIGNKDMNYKENFCKNNNYTFVRTYTVESISEYDGQQYTDDGIPFNTGNSFLITLSQFQGDTETVIINNLWDIKLEKGKTYEFEFMLDDDLDNIEDNILEIFNNSTIVEVRETDKIGLEQSQEAIIKE